MATSKYYNSYARYKLNLNLREIYIIIYRLLVVLYLPIGKQRTLSYGVNVYTLKHGEVLYVRLFKT